MDPRAPYPAWPPQFVCPISGSIMADPVIVTSGQTYERRCIQAWLDLGQRSCVTHGTPLDANFLVPNDGLKAAIALAHLARAQNVRPPEPPSVGLAMVLARRRLAQEGGREKEKKQEVAEEEEEEEEAVRHCRARGGKNSAVEDRLGEGRRSGQSCWEYQAAGRREEVANDCRKETQEGGEQEDARKRSRGVSRRSWRSGGTVQAMEILRLRGEEKEEQGEGSTRRGSEGSSSGRGVSSGSGGGGEGSGNGRGQRSGNGGNLERYSHSASGQVLREALGGRMLGYGGAQEVPLPLATKPSSYSAMTENSAAAASFPPSSTVFEALVSDLQSPFATEQEAAASQIRQLARFSAENRLALCRWDLIDALLPLFQSPYPNVQSNAVAALVNLSIAKENKVMIVRAGAVPPLVDVLHCGSPEAQEHAAGALFSLALSDENKTPIAVLDALPPLLRLLRSGPPGARQDAAMALYHLSLWRSNQPKLVKLDAVPTLLGLAQNNDGSDLSSRSLLILCNIAAVPDGRAALLEHSAIPTLVKLLCLPTGEKSSNRNAVEIPEHAAAVLLLLSKENNRFKSIATNAGALELLTALADRGTPRAQEKARALLAIMRESPPDFEDLYPESTVQREYIRRTWGRADGEPKSSAF